HRRGPARTAAPVGPRPPDHAHRLDGHRGADRDGPGRGAGRMTRVSAAWLGLREPADAAARAAELVEPVRRRLAVTPRAVVHDLGSGTGSMGRWLAPRLPGPQRW